MKLGVMGGKGKSVSAYRVIVQDGSGVPVKGAKVQVCSDLMCCAAKTDEAGIATFAGLDEGAYTAHVIGAPEGFAADDAEHRLPSAYGDIRIVLART